MTMMLMTTMMKMIMRVVGGGDGDDDGGGVTDKEVCPNSSSEHVNNSWNNLANFMKKHNLTDSAGRDNIFIYYLWCRR